jgi:signal transduction histidine kinase
VAVGRDLNEITAGWDGGIQQVALADLGGDGRVEAVATLSSAWDARPRGIVTLDWDEGRRIDEFMFGPGPTRFEVRDLDNDGKSEILLGTWAPGNDASVNGLDDSHTYAMVLNSDLRPRWVQPVGRYSSQVLVRAMHDTAEQLAGILACECGNSAGGRVSDSIFVLEPLTGKRQQATQVGRFNTMMAILYDTAMGTLAAVASSDDTLRLLDSRLNVVARRYVAGLGDGVQLCPGHFTGRRGEELVVAPPGRTKLILLDSHLDRLAEIIVTKPTSLRTVRRGSRDRLLVRTDAGASPQWRLYDLQLTPLLHRGIPIGVVIPGVLALLLLFVASMVYFRYRQARDTRTLIRGLTGQAGVVEIGHRGRVRHANPKGRGLLQLAGASESAPFAGALAPLGGTVRDASASRELPLSLPTGQTILARATPVKSGTLLTLEDISAVEYLKRISTWVPVAQKLAHDIKNPLTAISLTLRRVEKAAGPDSQRYVESMKDDIGRLKNMADGFMRLTKLDAPKLAPVDINDVVRQCAGRFDDVKPADVVFQYELAEGLPPAALDRDQMVVALSNIIENAMSAMGQSGRLVLRSTLVVGGKRIAVSVRDTGTGIPERYISKVFEPYFTLKPGGTGLGMALTKRIVDDHKGTIEIESKEGVGTTVTIELPVAGTRGA